MNQPKKKLSRQQNLIVNRDILLNLIAKFSSTFMAEDLLKSISIADADIFLDEWIEKNFIKNLDEE